MPAEKVEEPGPVKVKKMVRIDHRHALAVGIVGLCAGHEGHPQQAAAARLHHPRHLVQGPVQQQHVVQRRGGDDRIELRVLPGQEFGHPRGEVEGVLVRGGKRIEAADAIGRIAGQVERERLRTASHVQDVTLEVLLGELLEARRPRVRGDAATVHGKPLVGHGVGVQGFAPEGKRPRRQGFQAGEALLQAEARRQRGGRGPAPPRTPLSRPPSSLAPASTASSVAGVTAVPWSMRSVRSRNKFTSARRMRIELATSCTSAKSASTVARNKEVSGAERDIN